MWIKEEKFLHIRFQHKLMRRLTIIWPLHAGIVTQHIFVFFFPTKYLYSHFYIKTALYISLMSVPDWDLPTGKKESFWVNPSLISFCSLIFYFVFFIFLLLSLFVFWQTKCAHEKKKINMRAKNSNYVFWPAADCFRALRVSDEGVFISTNQSAVFQYSFRFNTSPRNDKMHK